MDFAEPLLINEAFEFFVEFAIRKHLWVFATGRRICKGISCDGLQSRKGGKMRVSSRLMRNYGQGTLTTFGRDYLEECMTLGRNWP